MDTNSASASMTAKDFMSGVKPVWCPGCGDFAVLSAVAKTLAELKLEPHNVAVISGIGCSSRIPAHVNSYGFHGLHGRALPLAIGLKVARPDLTVIAAGGDGDGFSIGGNHFLHACRRNVNMTYIVMDNQVYGMTKGQASPTTEPDWQRGKLTPGGPGINPFHPLVVALASGANFIARSFTGDPNYTAQILVEAVRHPGFSFVQLLSPCVTFREEQRNWKKVVRKVELEATGDPAQAARRLMTDTGFNLGVLYKGDRRVYAPEQKMTVEGVADLEKEFYV